MKKEIMKYCLVLIISGLVLAGCSRGEDNPLESDAVSLQEETGAVSAGETTEPSAEEDQTDHAVTEETEADALLVYRDVISQYEEAEEAKFYQQPEGFVDPSLSGDYVSDLLIIHTQYYASSDDAAGKDLLIAYALKDINGDGVPEFFVGAGTDLDAMTIYSVFTNDGTDPVPLCDVSYYGERTNLHVLADGRLADMGSGGAAYEYISFSSLPADGLELVTEQEYAMEEERYYFSDPENDHVSISEEEWNSAVDGFEGPCMDLDWTQMAVCGNGD